MSTELPTDPVRDEDNDHEWGEVEHTDADQEEAPQATFTDRETGEEKEWGDLTTDEKLDAMFGAVSELAGRTFENEHRITLVGQSLIRILQEAGELPSDQVQEPTIVVPRMDIPRDAGRKRS